MANHPEKGLVPQAFAELPGSTLMNLMFYPAAPQTGENSQKLSSILKAWPCQEIGSA